MGTKFNDNQCSFQDPVFIAGAQVGPRLISATATLPWFSTAEPRELTAVLSVHNYYTTSLAGSNNDLTWFARLSGNQAITITYVDPGGATSNLSVEVVDSDITITLARAASAIVTKASDIVGAIAVSESASALVSVARAAGNDGTGVVTALTQTSLAGPAGTMPTLDVELLASLDGVQPYSIDAKFGQKTDAADAEGGIFGRLGAYGAWSITVAGTTPEFAFSIVTMFKPGA